MVIYFFDFKLFVGLLFIGEMKFLVLLRFGILLFCIFILFRICLLLIIKMIFRNLKL